MQRQTLGHIQDEPSRYVKRSLEKAFYKNRGGRENPYFCRIVIGPAFRAANGRESHIGLGCRLDVDCLPGAMVSLTSKNSKHETEAFLTLLPEHDGKIVRLRFEDDACYKNDVPCRIAFPTAQNAKDVAKQLDVLKRAKNDKKMDGLSASIEVESSSGRRIVRRIVAGLL